MKLLYYMLIIPGLMSVVQGSAQSSNEVWNDKKAEAWLKKGEWKQGLKFNVHESLNKEEFARQYHANQALWDAAFAFMKQTNFETVAPGKYPIKGDDVYASITDGPTKEFEATKWEAHRKFIDIQFIYGGKEKIGIHSVSNETPVITPYNETKDVAFFDIKEGTFYVTDPGTFFIFFPQDGHRPTVKIDGVDTIKKLVIKVRAAQ